MAIAIEKWQLHKRVALWVLLITGVRPALWVTVMKMLWDKGLHGISSCLRLALVSYVNLQIISYNTFLQSKWASAWANLANGDPLMC